MDTKKVNYIIVMWENLLKKHTFDIIHCDLFFCNNMIKMIFGEIDTIVVQKQHGINWHSTSSMVMTNSQWVLY